MQDRNGVKGPPKNKFYNEGEQFLKKKQYYIDEQNAMMEREQQRMREQARLMSDNSRRINLEKNQSRSFLERNFYTKKPMPMPDRANKDRLNSAVSANRSQASGLRGGSRGSGLDNSGYSGYEDLAQGRMFSPQINANSRKMSPRSSQAQTF